MSLMPIFVAGCYLTLLRGKRGALIVGINNLRDDRYFLFRPFPQRTFLMEIHYAQ